MAQLILMRHATSIWNEQNLFTGWVDVPLSKRGVDEALKASEILAPLPIDIAFTSDLVRAQQTLFLSLLHHRSRKIPVLQRSETHIPHAKWHRIHDIEAIQNTIPVFANEALNERMYGILQGKNKDAAREEFGKERVEEWRRGYRNAPPDGESLAETALRTQPYFEAEILPRLQDDLHVLVVAHGNSLRSIVMMLEGLSEEEIPLIEIPMATPLIYRLNSSRFERTS